MHCMIIGSRPTSCHHHVSPHCPGVSPASPFSNCDEPCQKSVVSAPPGGWRMSPLTWCFWLFRLRSRNLSITGRQSGGSPSQRHEESCLLSTAVMNLFITAEADFHADVPLQLIMLVSLNFGLCQAATLSLCIGSIMKLNSWHSCTSRGCRFWSSLWYGTFMAALWPTVSWVHTLAVLTVYLVLPDCLMAFMNAGGSGGGILPESRVGSAQRQPHIFGAKPGQYRSGINGANTQQAPPWRPEMAFENP